MNRIAFFSLVMIVLSSHAFAQRINDPKVVLAGTSGTTVTRAQLLADPRLTDKNGVCEVKNFSISFFPTGHDLIGPFTTKGNTLSPAEIDVLRKIPLPAKIVVEDIRATGSDGVPRPLGSITLKVTE